MGSRITIVSGIFPPESGGPATFALEFSKWLIDKGISPTVITLGDGESNVDNVQGIEVRKVSRNKFIFSRFLSTCKLIISSSKNSSAIIVNGCFLETLFASFVFHLQYTAKIPGDIVWERARNQGDTHLNINEFQKSKKKIKYLIMRKLFSASVSRASAVIVPSLELKDLCAEWGINATKVHVIYNSVSEKIFSIDSSIVKVYDVISVGRLVPWKGFDELIRVCKTLNLSLAIVGDGPEENELKQLARKVGANVHFLGRVSKPELQHLYNKSRLFVLNSAYEGTSHTLLEARMCGLTTLAKSGVGSNDLVINDNIDGFLFGGNKNRDLATTLELALNSSIDSIVEPREIVNNTQLRFGSVNSFMQIYKIMALNGSQR